MSNIDVSDRNRRNLIRKLARDASLTSLQYVLEEVAPWANEETVNVLADAIGEVLEGPEKSSYYDVFNRKYTKPNPETCDPRKCPTCYWRFICEAEASYKLIQEAHSALAKWKAKKEEYRRIGDTKQTRIAEPFFALDKDPIVDRDQIILRNPSIDPKRYELLRKKKDYQLLRKMAHDTLKKQRANN